MSLNVGGILVRAQAGRTRITPAMVIRAVEAFWTQRGAKLGTSSHDLEPLGVASGKRRLGYAVLPATGGWIAVADSERYHADHALAQHLAAQLEVEVLWYTLYGATDAGVAQWFGSKREDPPATYDAVEALVQELANACVYYDQLPADDELVRVVFTGVTRRRYTIGPLPDAEEDDEDDDDEPGELTATAQVADPVASTPGSSLRAPFERITIPGRKGGIAGRDTLSLGFSCRVPIQKMAKAVLATLDHYLAAIPTGALRWSLIGSSSTKITPIRLSAARRLLEQPPAHKDIYFFLHGSEDTQDDAPSWLFLCSGRHDVTPQKMAWGEVRPTTQLELRFPSDFLWQLGADRFVELATRIAALLPAESGFASIAVSWSPLVSTISQEAPMKAGPIVLAHPGLDLFHDAFTLGGHCRGAQWLTILGPSLVERLGGRPFVAASMDPAVGVVDAGPAMILRAGHAPHPELTVEDRGLRESVARTIKPVTLFDCDNRVGFPNRATKQRWLHRFVDDAP